MGQVAHHAEKPETQIFGRQAFENSKWAGSSSGRMGRKSTSRPFRSTTFLFQFARVGPDGQTVRIGLGLGGESRMVALMTVTPSGWASTGLISMAAMRSRSATHWKSD